MRKKRPELFVRDAFKLVLLGDVYYKQYADYSQYVLVGVGAEWKIPSKIVELAVDKRTAVHLVNKLLEGWKMIQPELYFVEATNEFAIRVPYNVDWIAHVKNSVNPGMRRFDPSTKTWFFRASVLETVQKITLKFFPDIKTTMPAVAETSDAIVNLGEFVQKLPDKLFKAVGRSIMMVMHPDRAQIVGTTNDESHKLFIDFQKIWQQIEKERVE